MKSETIRPFQEARDLDEREAECWRMFGAQEPQWDEAIRQAPRPVVLTLEQFYTATTIPDPTKGTLL